MKKICLKCKKDFPEWTTVCPECGSKLKSAETVNTVSTLLSLPVMLIMITALFLLSFSVLLISAFNEDNIASFADKLDVVSLPADRINIVPVEGKVLPSKPDIADAIYAITEDDSPTPADIREAYKSGTFRGRLKEQLIGYGKFISKGESFDPVTVEKATAVFDENIELVNSIALKPLTEKDINNAHEKIGMFDGFFKNLTPEALESSYGLILSQLRAACSVAFPITAGIVWIGCLALLWLIHRKKTHAMLSWGGMTALLNGCFVIAAAGIFSVNMLNSRGTFSGELILCAAGVILPSVYIAGAVCAVCGLFMILTGAKLRNKLDIIKKPE